MGAFEIMRPSQVMFYILEDNNRIELEIGSMDIFDYEGQTIYCDDEDFINEVGDEGSNIDDDFILNWDWFEDHPDWPQANAYRKGMGCSIQEAFDQWEEVFVGAFDSEADFSKSLHSELTDKLPSFIQSNIDWQGVWDSTDRHEYFESDGYYFMYL